MSTDPLLNTTTSVWSLVAHFQKFPADLWGAIIVGAIAIMLVSLAYGGTKHWLSLSPEERARIRAEQEAASAIRKKKREAARARSARNNGHDDDCDSEYDDCDDD